MSDSKLLFLYVLAIVTLLVVALLSNSRALAVLAGVTAGWFAGRFDRQPGFRPRRACKACIAANIRPPRRGTHVLDGGAPICAFHALEARSFGFDAHLMQDQPVPFPSVEGCKEARLMQFPSVARRKAK